MSSAEAVGNGLDLGGVDEQRNVPAVVTKGGVGCDDNVLLGAVLDQRKVGVARVTLDLIDSGDDTSSANNTLKLVAEDCQ